MSRYTTDFPFCVCVPHQRPAYIDRPDESPPIEADGDRLVAGDHDLHSCHMIESEADAQDLINRCRIDHSLHQRLRIAAILEA